MLTCDVVALENRNKDIVFCNLLQEGDCEAPLLMDSFRNGDSTGDSTRFGFFKVCL